jgi:branched-chain amino acid transport system substrate-binding protein
MSANPSLPTLLKGLSVAAVAILIGVALVACGGGGSKSSDTPTGSASGGPTANPEDPAKGLLVIAPPDATNAVLSDALELGAVKTYLLTSLSQDPASFEGLGFAGDELVWGAQTSPPEANRQPFIDAYVATYGEEPADPVLAASAYDAVYLTALAATAAATTDPATIRDNITYVANSPGDVVGYGGDQFASAVEVLGTDGEVNYIGASGQVDIDAEGELSKGGAQTWRVINGQIAPIETRDVDLAAESGDEVSAGELKRGTASDQPLTIGIVVTDDDTGRGLSLAATLAVDEINTAGGVLGQETDLQVQTILTADEASGAASALLDAGASAIIGPNMAEAVGPALDVVKGASVALLALSSAPELSALEGEGSFFRLVPSIAQQMPVLANLALESDADSICVMYVSGDAGAVMADAFGKAMAFKSAVVKNSLAFDPAAGDYASLLETCIGSEGS